MKNAVNKETGQFDVDIESDEEVLDNQGDSIDLVAATSSTSSSRNDSLEANAGVSSPITVQTTQPNVILNMDPVPALAHNVNTSANLATSLLDNKNVVCPIVIGNDKDLNTIDYFINKI